MTEEALALEAIQKKLSGKRLNYNEIFAIMDEISKDKLGIVLTTYFAASGYTKGFNDQELYFLTKAMIETGEQLHFKGIVADKHSVGGVPGTRTTLIVTPIVAAAGFTIPKSSSRAITTPGGTADDMEVLSPVTFNKEQIYKIVAKTNACIVWGGGVDIAPADDELITVEKPLSLESYDKILVSIMAKKIAFSSNHIVIDLPYGPSVKIPNRKEAEIVGAKFEMLARKFGVKLYPHIHNTTEPAGKGIGPLLEAKEALRVLEQRPDRPMDLEEKALQIAGILLDLCLEDARKPMKEHIKKEFGTGAAWAAYILSSGHALKKMREIIAAQGGKADVQSTDLKPGKFSHDVMAHRSGKIHAINSKNTSTIAKILGAPKMKKSGLYFHLKSGDHSMNGKPVFTLYSEEAYNLKEAIDSLQHFPILEYV
jgi:putative thymidine phosphorylase